MLLTIDVGNTQTTLGVFDKEGQVARQWRMATDQTDTIDELGMHVNGYFMMCGEKVENIGAVAIASVVPLLTQRWCSSLQAFGLEPYVVQPNDECGIDIDMPYPTQVGADRITNAVAAKQTYGAPVMVVDFGTATTIDVVDENGAFRGGAIMPGFMVATQSLLDRAAKLSSIPLVAPKHALGTTTEEAIQSGIVLGAAKQIEGLTAQIKEELGRPDAKVIATGGLSTVVAEATDVFDALDPELTLRGIWLIWQKHHEKEKLAKKEASEN